MTRNHEPLNSSAERFILHKAPARHARDELRNHHGSMRADVTEILRRFGGIATRSQIVGSGVTPADLSSATRGGIVSRVRRAHYRAADADRDGVDAVAIGGRLSCLSAARTYGLWASRDPRLHVRVPSNAGRLREAPTSDAVRLHWDDGELSEFCWRDSLADCLRSTVACCDIETAVAVIDSAYGSGMVTVPAVRRIFQHEPRRSRFVAELARPGSESGVESIARQRLERAGSSWNSRCRSRASGESTCA